MNIKLITYIFNWTKQTGISALKFIFFISILFYIFYLFIIYQIVLRYIYLGFCFVRIRNIILIRMEQLTSNFSLEQKFSVQKNENDLRIWSKSNIGCKMISTVTLGELLHDVIVKLVKNWFLTYLLLMINQRKPELKFYF